MSGDDVEEELRVAYATAARVMHHEADAIATMADNLQVGPFAQAAELLARCSGNVASIGAGTSGIVARKVAATLTSTGTPALFVHPSDALHGGLGFIGNQEIVVAISKSGETDELLALLPYLASREVPVIALVGELQSTLGRKATIALRAHTSHEADRHDMVPTSSVAVTLALADALALAVMEIKDVTPDRFAANHPSGQLGRRLTLRVRDVMHGGDDCPVVSADADFMHIVSAITAGGLGAVTVLDSERCLLGIVTDGDIRRAAQNSGGGGPMHLRARDVMTERPVSIGSDVMARDALLQMEDRPSQIAVLPVIDEGRCVGIVRLHDLVRIGL